MIIDDRHYIAQGKTEFIPHLHEQLGMTARDLIRCRKLGLVRVIQVDNDYPTPIRWLYNSSDMRTLKRRYAEHLEQVARLKKAVNT